jgi:hypothetical protein
LSFSRIYVTIFLISNIDNKSGNIFAFLTNLVNSWKDNLPPVDITCLDYNVLNFDLFEINNIIYLKMQYNEDQNISNLLSKYT